MALPYGVPLYIDRPTLAEKGWSFVAFWAIWIVIAILVGVLA